MGGNVRVAGAAGAVYVKMGAEAVANICPALKAFMDRMMRSGRQSFIIDMGGCKYVDSCFMGMLLEVVMERDSRVVVINTSSDVKSRFELLGLTQFLPVKQGNVAIPSNLSLHLLRTGAAGKRLLTEVVERAHRQLIKADERNRPRFEALLRTLRKELRESELDKSKLNDSTDDELDNGRID